MKKILVIAVTLAAILVVIWPETLKLTCIIISSLVLIINLICGSQAKIWRWCGILSILLLIISTFLYAFNIISDELLIGLVYSSVALGLPRIATLLRKGWLAIKKEASAYSRRVFLVLGCFLFSEYHCMHNSLILHTHFMDTILVYITLTRQNYTR